MNWEELRDLLLKEYKDIEFQGHVVYKKEKWVEEIFVETEKDSFYIDVPIINYSAETDYMDFLYSF